MSDTTTIPTIADDVLDAAAEEAASTFAAECAEEGEPLEDGEDVTVQVSTHNEQGNAMVIIERGHRASGIHTSWPVGAGISDWWNHADTDVL